MISWFSNFKAWLYRLLRRSERYTKTDMVYLASGSFWAIVGQASAVLIALGLAIVVARFVPKNVYGNYKYILATISLLTTFSLSGIGTAVFQSIARGFRRSLTDGFIMNLRWSVLVFLGALIVGGYYFSQNNIALGAGILLGGCLTPFLTSFNLYTSLFSGEKDFRRIAWYGDFVTNIIPALGLIAVAYYAPTPLNLVATYFVTNTAAAAYAYWRGIYRYPITPSDPHDSNMLSYGKHLSLMGILSGFAGNIDQILLFHFGGAINVAIYNFAIAMPNQIKGFMKTIGVMVTSKFSRHTPSNIHRNMKMKMVWLFIFLVIITATYILAAPFVFKFIFPRYTDAVIYSQLYALSLLTIITYPMSSYMTAHKEISGQYHITIFGSIFQIILMTIGIMYAGLIGLIIARVITRIFNSFVTLYFYTRAIHNKVLL